VNVDNLGMAPPRIFCIPALDAPVLAVLRRGPSTWSHVGRWDTERGIYESGAWIKANVYPQRCDVSPDGRWLVYFTLNSRGSWSAGTTFIAVSRLPWLTALAAWGTCGTWSRGAHFVHDRSRHELGEPDEGDARALVRRYGLACNSPSSFAVERRRGWTETPQTPTRAERDLWDERRADHIVMTKPRPGGGRALLVQGRFAAFRAGPIHNEPRQARYTLRTANTLLPLDDVQWADWDTHGRLLIATNDGKLQARNLTDDGATLEWEHDLSRLRPDPTPAPASAHHW
jgi:hypothetical protein